MNKVFKVLVISVLLGASTSASAWWGGPYNGYGPYNNWGNWGNWGPWSGFGDGSGDGAFDMSFSGKARSDVHGSGRGYGYGGYPYYGYPYRGGPWGAAPYGYAAPVAPAAPAKDK